MISLFSPLSSMVNKLGHVVALYRAIKNNIEFLLSENRRANGTRTIQESIHARKHELRKTHGLGFHSYFH